MKGVIFAFTNGPVTPLTPLGEEPIVKIVEKRLLRAKRIEEVFTLVPPGQLKRYSLHVSNPVEVRAKNEMEALIKGLPSGDIFLVEGRMPLVMPFLVNYLTTIYFESGAEAVIPAWADGSLEVFHAVYDSKALKDALRTCISEGERKILCIGKYIDYESVSIEELTKKNPKVTLSFLRVRSSIDLKFAEENLRQGI